MTDFTKRAFAEAAAKIGATRIETTADEVADERERCALLAEDLAGRWEASANRLRDNHKIRVGWLWRRVIVHPAIAKQAASMDDAAHGLRRVAQGIRAGWDVRKLHTADRGDAP